MSRIRGAIAGLILLGATIGLPVLLAATVGNPLHDRHDWHSVLSGNLSDTDAIDLLAAVFYLAWASFVIPVAVEIVTVLTGWIGHRPPRQVRLPLLGPQHDLARVLVGAVLLLLPAAIAATAPSTHAPITPPPATLLSADTSWSAPPGTGSQPAVSGDQRLPATGQTTPPARTYVIPAVGGMRSYWALAEHYLGDGQRWREIWQVNAGRVQDGTVLDTPRRLAPGWTILIPPAASTAAPLRGDTATHPVTVAAGDTLSGLAAADGIGDWHQVWPANSGRPEPGGRYFTDPNLILPGWTLRLPDPAAPLQHAAPQTADPPPTEPQAAPEQNRHPSPAEPTRPDAAARPVAPVVLPTPATPDAPQPTGLSPTPTSRPARSAPGDARPATGDATSAPVPFRTPLEIGLAALAALTVLDRARRIALRRRRPGHRPSPPPVPLADVERRLRQQARQARPAVTAIQLAGALTATAPVACRAVVARDDGAVDLLLDPPPATAVPAPFESVEGGWRLPADATGFGFALDDVADPYPVLVPVGRTADGAVLVDLAATGPVGVAGDPNAVKGYLAGLVRALAGAPWADRLSLHVPAALGERIGPLDNVTVEDTRSPGADSPEQQPSTAGADTTGASAEAEEPGWDTRPLHLFCGWSVEDDIDPLMRLAADPATGTLAVVAGLHPAAAAWTLDGDCLLLPNLPDPITVAVADGQHGQDEAAGEETAVVELLEHTATAADVPLGDPQLPDLGGHAPPSPAPTPVQINVLGPVELTGSQHPRRSQTLHLLAYLALHRRGVDRDQIATALWPDTLAAGKTIRNRISEARVLVGNAISDGPCWQLDESVTTDWQQFTALAAGSSAEQHQALTLVRGRPFAGLDDTEWIDLEGFRTELEAAVVDLALSVAERDLAAGDHAAAYTAARAGLSASRYEERLHRLAIRAAHAEGSVAKVRTLQHEMRTVLDLDIEPDDQIQDDTLDLYEDLRARTAGN